VFAAVNRRTTVTSILYFGLGKTAEVGAIIALHGVGAG